MWNSTDFNKTSEGLSRENVSIGDNHIDNLGADRNCEKHYRRRPAYSVMFMGDWLHYGEFMDATNMQGPQECVNMWKTPLILNGTSADHE